MIPLSIIDNANLYAGQTHGDSLAQVIETARAADDAGYRRYWMAEHHNLVSTASTASGIVLGRIAAATTRIRVGFGGILPANHTALAIAEQVGTLDSFHPGRIDVGLGRAPGTDLHTAHYLRRGERRGENAFEEDVSDLLSLLSGQTLRAAPSYAYPPTVSEMPVWILGSGMHGATYAAREGLPYAFAGHFAPARMHDAIRHYKRKFRPSVHLEQPYAITTVNVVAAPKQSEAERLSTSQSLYYSRMSRGVIQPVPCATDPSTFQIPPEARELLAARIIGTPATLPEQLSRFASIHDADELMVMPMIHDLEARIRSIKLTIEASSTVVA